MLTQEQRAFTEYDPFAENFYDDAPRVYRWMRDEAPVYYSQKRGFWALSRYQDVRAAVKDAQTFLNFEGIDIDDTAKDQSGPGFLPDIDNPRHDELRRIVQPDFLRGRIAALEESIRQIVRTLMAGWRDRGEVDLAQELAWPLPYEVFFSLLGLPKEDYPQLVTWSHELKDRLPNDPRLTPVAKLATANLWSYFAQLLKDRRAHPHRRDLLTHMVTAHIGGKPFAEPEISPESEIVRLTFVLFMAGIETTAGLVSAVFRALAEYPDQRALLREDPSLIPSAVEEGLRFSTPLQVVGRTTSREVRLHDVSIPKGARVFLVYGAANRDDREFPDPDHFDVTRGRIRQLAFGEGLHMCVGAPLARLELQVALEEVLPVLGDYTIAAPPVRYRTTPNADVLNNLLLAFTPR